MAEYVLKYADGRGQIHQQVAAATSEKELRDRYSSQGFLIYSIKPRGATGGLMRRGKKINVEKFLIFNQQFVTLIRAGLPILKGLDLLADRLTDPKLGPHVKAVREDVRNGTLLSEAFRAQGVFPKIYVTRSEEHTSELQSPCNLVCRLLLEKKKQWRRAGPQIDAGEHGAGARRGVSRT